MDESPAKRKASSMRLVIGRYSRASQATSCDSVAPIVEPGGSDTSFEKSGA